METLRSNREEITEIYQREEIMWRQRSKKIWLKKGDQNIKYFYKVANGRRSNQITSQKINGGRVEDQEEIRKHIDSYYKKNYNKRWKGDKIEERNMEEEGSRCRIEKEI